MSAPAREAATSPPGFYGKVPTKGDFVHRRLGRPFVDGWDGWLQSAIACSQEQLGQAWTETYLTSPLWRFCLDAGVCGDDAMAGVLMPSVDRVGRYFPLTIATALPGAGVLSALPSAMAEWFDWAEDAALSCLDDDFDFDGFDGRLAEAPAAEGSRPVPASVGSAAMSPFGLTASIGGNGPGPDPATLADHLLDRVFGRCSLWWTTGSAQVAPILVACGGLPKIGGFAAFLDGQWARWGWSPDAGPEAGDAGILPKEKKA